MLLLAPYDPTGCLRPPVGFRPAYAALPALLGVFACTAPKDAPVEDTGVADTGDTGPVDDGLDEARETLRQKVKMAVRTGQASGAQVAVWKDGAIVFSEGIGTRDPDTEDPVLPTTLFEVGSDTKKMTALALLRQVEAGRATLDSTVADVLPDFTLAASPDWAGTTTLHELLSHQGGLVDYTPWDNAPEDAELAGRMQDRFGPDAWAMLPSGVAYNYANPNFSLAGLVVEELEGRAYADVLEEDLFAPLGLTRTFAREAAAEADGDYAIGTGYYLTEDAETLYPLTEAMPFATGRVPLDLHPDNGFTRPAGLVWSTAEDMAHLIAFLMEGDASILSDDLRARMTTMHVPTYPDVTFQGYGYGVMVLPEGWNGEAGWHPTPYWTHGGNTLSYTSSWCALPEYGIVITIQSNGYGDQMTNACAAGLEAFVPELPVSAAPTLFEAVGELEQYVGTWYDPHTVGTIEVTTDGEELYVDMPDLEAAGTTVGNRLEGHAENLFTVTLYGQPYELLYYDGPGGEKQYIVDRLFAAERVTGGAARPAPRFPARVLAPKIGPTPPIDIAP